MALEVVSSAMLNLSDAAQRLYQAIILTTLVYFSSPHPSWHRGIPENPSTLTPASKEFQFQVMVTSPVES
jgi:hypothetical protein